MTELAVRIADLPALLDASEQALALVTNADEAEVEYRKAKAIDQVARLAKVNASTRLRAGCAQLRWERRWGELLGKAEPTPPPPGGVTDGNAMPSSERIARHRARELWEVREEIFSRYLAGVRDPELLRRVRLFRLQREWEAEQRRSQPIEPTWKQGDIEIRHGDFRNVLTDLVGQVDAIVTDPPYLEEFIDEYDALGELATQILTPHGMLVVMVGQMHLPRYFERLGRHLTYRWCAAYLTDGPATRFHARSIATKWKPLLLYDRGDDRRFLTQDVFRSDRPEKQLKGQVDGWGQSESGMADIVSRVTEPGQLVVDPFLGAGTTAVVCRDLGRRFIGCDIDADAVQTTRNRLG